jgi:SAM-dependent methyltransferase
MPEKFNKNESGVRARGTPAYTGGMLIEYMCRRIGIADLGQRRVLDLGCGCRFAEALTNLSLPIGYYFGIDLDREMIDWLSGHITDPRLRFQWWDARNPSYNPLGQPLSDFAALPVDGQTFDIACMFSVITHQLPDDAERLLRLLRLCILPTGHLFFSATLESIAEGYRELVPDHPTAHSAYSADHMLAIIDRAGWRIISVEPKLPSDSNGVTIPIQDSFLCVPA